MKKIIVLFLTMMVAFATGCSTEDKQARLPDPTEAAIATAPTENSGDLNEPEATPDTPETSEPTPAEQPEEISPTEKPDIEYNTEELANTSGKTMIKLVTNNKNGNGGHVTIGIVSASGTVVVADPYSVPRDKGLIKADIITTSHHHPDHRDLLFENKNRDAGDVYHSNMTAETFTVKDVTVTGVGSSHHEQFFPINPSNYIYVVEVDGLRIAHMGDVGQRELTEEQLQQLGEIDILFMPFSDVNQYGFYPENTINIVKQTKPKLISPLHFTEEAIDLILKELNVTQTFDTDVYFVDAAAIAELEETTFMMLN